MSALAFLLPPPPPQLQVLTFPSTYVDVRDVAAGHVNALDRLPALHGRRFVLAGNEPCLPGGALGLLPVAQACFPEASFDQVRLVSKKACGLTTSGNLEA